MQHQRSTVTNRTGLDMLATKSKLEHGMESVEQIRQLACVYRQEIPETYRDEMGHMNVRWYMAIYDRAAWQLFARFGMDFDYCRRTQTGLFALEQHVRYLAEVLVGDTVAVHARLLSLTAKRLYVVMYMVNETTNRPASMMEDLTSHADLALRRTTPFSAELTRQLQTLLDQHNALDWRSTTCGVIQA